MERDKLEKLRFRFGILCAIGIFLFFLMKETTYLDIIEERIQLIVIPFIIVISMIGMWLTTDKINLKDAYEKGREEERLFQLVEKKKKEGEKNKP